MEPKNAMLKFISSFISTCDMIGFISDLFAREAFEDYNTSGFRASIIHISHKWMACLQ